MKRQILNNIFTVFIFTLFSTQLHAQCAADFTHVEDANGKVTFTNTSTGGGAAVLYSWDFGDGGTSIGENATHQYDNPGSYTVCLVMLDMVRVGGCSDTTCKQITVANQNTDTCKADFTHTPFGSTVISFSNSSSSNYNSFTWDFGNGNTSTQKDPFEAYVSTGTYTVCLIAVDTNGRCPNDTICQSVDVGTAGISEANNVLSFDVFPNPVKDITNISYTLIESGKVDVSVYDLVGNKVENILSSEKTVGNHQLNWSTDHLSKGAYLLRIATNQGQSSRVIFIQ